MIRGHHHVEPGAFRRFQQLAIFSNDQPSFAVPSTWWPTRNRRSGAGMFLSNRMRTVTGLLCVGYERPHIFNRQFENL